MKNFTKEKKLLMQKIFSVKPKKGVSWEEAGWNFKTFEEAKKQLDSFCMSQKEQLEIVSSIIAKV